MNYKIIVLIVLLTVPMLESVSQRTEAFSHFSPPNITSVIDAIGNIHSDNI